MPELVEEVLPPVEGSGESTPDPPKRRGRPPGSKNKQKTELLEKELSEKLTEFIGLPISFVSPVAAEVLNQRSEKTVRALVLISAKNPAFEKALRTFMEGSAYFDIVATVVGMGIGFAVDHQQIEPTAFPAVVFKIDEIVAEIYPPIDETQNGNGSHIAGDRGLLGEI